MGVFDYADGTPGDVAKDVTNAANNSDHGTLPTFVSSLLMGADFSSNENYYLCVYKKDGNKGAVTTWENAVNKCADGSYADGSTGWYLPNARELKVIYEALKIEGDGLSYYQLVSRGIMLSYTEGMASNYYWSSMEVSATNAWRFSFATGIYDHNPSKASNNYVRCVRRISSI
ncbi:hypothetical protein FACS189413_15310 [Bacteroidia bacterium]|nr:hypothetical protein FACS189413_15310 [Bacteroidia bacterium]